MIELMLLLCLFAGTEHKQPRGTAVSKDTDDCKHLVVGCVVWTFFLIPVMATATVSAILGCYWLVKLTFFP